VYIDNVNFVLKKYTNTNTLSITGKKLGLKIDVDENMCMFMSHQQNTAQKS
jgi:hypothetical protein